MTDPRRTLRREPPASAPSLRPIASLRHRIQTWCLPRICPYGLDAVVHTDYTSTIPDRTPKATPDAEPVMFTFLKTAALTACGCLVAFAPLGAKVLFGMAGA